MRPDTLPQRGDVFQHFKGGYYLVLEVAIDVDAESSHVIYTPLYPLHQGKVVTRALDNWLEPKGDVQRFRRVPPHTLSCCGDSWVARATNRLQILSGHSPSSHCTLVRNPDV